MFGLKERQLNFHHGQFIYIYTLTIAYLQFTDELDPIISCGIPISLLENRIWLNRSNTRLD